MLGFFLYYFLYSSTSALHTKTCTHTHAHTGNTDWFCWVTCHLLLSHLLMWIPQRQRHIDLSADLLFFTHWFIYIFCTLCTDLIFYVNFYTCLAHHNKEECKQNKMQHVNIPVCCISSTIHHLLWNVYSGMLVCVWVCGGNGNGLACWFCTICAQSVLWHVSMCKTFYSLSYSIHILWAAKTEENPVP